MAAPIPMYHDDRGHTLEKDTPVMTPPASDMEKEVAIHNESVLDAFPDPDAHLSADERRLIDKKLVRKIDLKLVPWLCFLYLLSFLDRTNIGNARIAGMTTDLRMDGTQYNLTLTIFFISYALFEPLTNVLLKRLRPSIFLPIIMVIWGIVMTLMGVVSNYGGLLACRFMLGIFEAGLFPGVQFYLSCWYRRDEFGLRSSVFFSAAAIAGSFGGLLAAAIVNMGGIGGYQGWRWIFILEGLLTVIVGVVSYWILQDFPDDAKFLTDVDRQRVMRRLRSDQRNVEHQSFDMKYLIMALKDYKMWLGMIIYAGIAMPLYAFSLFLPSIIAGLKIGNGATTTNQLLTVPPYVIAALLTILVGYLGDKTKVRGYYSIGCSLIAIAGFAMLLGSEPTAYGIKYAGTFLGAAGIYPCVSNHITWMSSNIEGVYKRGIVLGFVIGWGNLNGVVSSNIYQASDAPGYRQGHGIVLGWLIVFLFGGSILLHLLLRRENRLRREGKRDHWVQGMNVQEREMLGDRRPDFVYTL